MTDDTDRSEPTTDSVGEWPLELAGVTETAVTTLGPNDRWNAAALGVFGPDRDDEGRVTARTWGRTRTRRNFEARSSGYVQFVCDPVAFVEAALSVSEHEEPILESAAAWVRVSVDRLESGTENDTEWVRWELEPVEGAIEFETVPTINRGFGAVIEATVAASRLGVSGYDDAKLRQRLEYFESVVERAGGPREREAFELVRAQVDRPDQP